MPRPPALLVAAPRTSSGKSVVTLSLIRAFRHRGLRIGSFKTGPDYIDPAFHARASGRTAWTLDSWAMRLETLLGQAERAARDADLVIGEGVMGLFDGAPDGTGSTADLASLLGMPVLLVLDADGMGASVAALAQGFLQFREDVEVTGIVLNRVAGERHAALLVEACRDRVAAPVVGWLPRDPTFELPRRHLGLVQALEHPDLDERIDAAAWIVARRLDLDLVLRLARPPSVNSVVPATALIPPLGQRIAVAGDRAFAFAYPAVLEGWRRSGSEIRFFSPLHDEPPAADADAVYLPGGYPELEAGRLAANAAFLEGLRAAARRGAAIFGECGGYMVLGRGLVDAEGRRHEMAGLLPVETSFAQRRLHLGYRRIRSLAPSPLGPAGQAFRGHEFHYASLLAEGDRPLFRAEDSTGGDLGHVGCIEGRVAGSFIHLIDGEPGITPPAGLESRARSS